MKTHHAVAIAMFAGLRARLQGPFASVASEAIIHPRRGGTEIPQSGGLLADRGVLSFAWQHRRGRHSTPHSIQNNSALPQRLAE
jgi:hypothetical protein